MFLRGIFASAVLAPALVVALAQNAERTEKAILTDLKKSAEEIDFDRLGVDTKEKAAAEARKKAAQAEGLLKEFEAAHGKSAQLADARALALRPAVVVLRFAQAEADVKRCTTLIGSLREAAAKGSDNAALAELSDNQVHFLGFVAGITSLDAFKKVWAKEEASFTKRAEDFMAAYPKFREGAEFYGELVSMYDAVGADKLRSAVLAHIAKNFTDHPLAKTAARDAKVGREFVFKFTPVGSSKELSIADLRGKVVVIDFWATWCGPCKAEMPNMKKLYAEYREKGVEFIGVSLDDEAAPLVRYVKDNAIAWPQAQGAPAQKLSTEWGVEGIPTLFIIDRKGNLRSMSARGRLETLIPQLLAEM
jgi:thiol-disulfide isomerase/thioredoxin